MAAHKSANSQSDRCNSPSGLRSDPVMGETISVRHGFPAGASRDVLKVFRLVGRADYGISEDFKLKAITVYSYSASRRALNEQR